MQPDERSELYAILSEALDKPPHWMRLEGRDWPLYALAAAVLPGSAGLAGLEKVPAAGLSERQAAHAELFSAHHGPPRFALRETAFPTQDIPENVLENLSAAYAAAGFSPSPGQDPDSAITELAFLAFLASDPEQILEEKRFIKEHAGRWMTHLGRSLAHSGSALYGPIGQILLDCFYKPVPRNLPPRPKRVPFMKTPDACTLCGDCVEICPVDALLLPETRLELLPRRCIGCARCVASCDLSLLGMRTLEAGSPDQLVLFG